MGEPGLAVADGAAEDGIGAGVVVDGLPVGVGPTDGDEVCEVVGTAEGAGVVTAVVGAGTAIGSVTLAGEGDRKVLIGTVGAGLGWAAGGVGAEAAGAGVADPGVTGTGGSSGLTGPRAALFAATALGAPTG